MAFQSTCEHWRLSGCLFGHPLFRVQAWPWAFPSPSVGAAMMSCSRAWAGPAGPWPASYHRATSVSAPEGGSAKIPISAGLCRHCSAAWVRSWLWYHGEKGPCYCVFVGLGPMGTHGGSHHHAYHTVPITMLISHSPRG